MEENKIPVHIAIVPDGNRRWAREKGLIATAGHVVAAKDEHLRSLIKTSKEMGVKYVSLWGFSTENWKRDKGEVNKLFEIISNSVATLGKEAHKEKICVKHIGRKDRLPEKLMNSIKKLEEETKEYSDFYLLLCIDYGGRDEIIRGINKLIKEGKKEINEKEFSDYLDTKGIPDVELIIRTGGDERISGFMPYQAVYSEFYFTKTYFPAFDSKELKKAIKGFGKRERRFGGNSK